MDDELHNMVSIPDFQWEHTDLDARRLRFCVEYRAWPTLVSGSVFGCLVHMDRWYLSFERDGTTMSWTNDDPIKCIDLAMRSVGK